MYKLIQYPDCKWKFDYYVNEKGIVWSDYSDKEMIPIVDKDGYLRVRLTTAESKRRNFPVHRLVLMMFAPCKNMMELQVNHIDGNKHNNTLSNLEWCTCQENINHAVRVGLRDSKGENNYFHKLSASDVRNIKKLYSTGNYTQRTIAKIYSIHEGTVYQIVNNRRWKHIA